MRLLLDTHALLWWLLGSTKLSDDARSVIADKNLSVLVSPVSAFEVTLKHRLGKLPDAAEIASGFGGMLVEEGFVGLPLSVEAALLAGSLDWYHKDPFDSCWSLRRSRTISF